MKLRKHMISRVLPDSIAEELGLEPGDRLVSVNGQPVEDVFDYRYLMNEELVVLLVEKPDGEEWELEVEKEYEEDLGIEFENGGLMDDYRSCSNKCMFCFIDQMPPGMRETLYFKDDDSRLSFLQGNYVTLTNMSEKDIERVIRYHLEPINISFQAMNPELRCKMLHNRFAGKALDKVDMLYNAGITMNGQIVLCKGVNDGDELEYSLEKLSAYAATEWHRISLTVLALGGDPTCFGTDADGNNIDLIADGTYNRSETASLGAQGVNAYIWSLITLDSLGYEVPAESGDTREDMISAVLGSQLGDGGFSLDGKKSDIDITAMALQALSPYREDETVAAAAERAILYLSEEQTPSGDFISWGQRSLESTAQVAVVLCTLGIDPETDSRFIKDGNNIISSIMNYRADDGGFLRTYDNVPDKKESSDYVASEQALRALCAFYRYRNGLRSFYDFRSETEAQTDGMLYGIFDGDIFSASSGFGEKEYSEYLALPESPDGSYYTEVTRLYMKFLEAGSPKEYQNISEGLAEKKRTVDRIYNEIDALSSEISEKLYPIDELSDEYREMILSLIERAEKLSEYDRSRISGIDELYLAKDAITAENVRLVYIFAALCILFIAAALICLVYKKQKSTHTENKN